MANIFSKRSQQSEQITGGLIYENFGHNFKIQIIHVFRAVVDYFPEVRLGRSAAFIFYPVEQALCAEYGVFELSPGCQQSEDSVCDFFLKQPDVKRCLDVIEVFFAQAIRIIQNDLHVHFDGMRVIGQAVEAVNARFRENRIGYELREGRIIRIDSEYVHKEVVAPAMTLLEAPYLQGANKEFLQAHEHFRHGRFGEAINECLKAFESTMKSICHKRRWQYSQNDTAKRLLEICEKSGLFPPYMQSSLAGLRAVLENVATIRNKVSAHGQGVVPPQITNEVAAFVIHSTSANILFLTALEKRVK